MIEPYTLRLWHTKYTHIRVISVREVIRWRSFWVHVEWRAMLRCFWYGQRDRRSKWENKETSVIWKLSYQSRSWNSRLRLSLPSWRALNIVDGRTRSKRSIGLRNTLPKFSTNWSRLHIAYGGKKAIFVFRSRRPSGTDEVSYREMIVVLKRFTALLGNTGLDGKGIRDSNLKSQASSIGSWGTWSKFYGSNKKWFIR